MTDAPEGFKPFEFDTGMGILRLPDRKCVLCLSNGTYWACTRCTYKEILNEHLVWEANKMNKELIDYIKEHPESVQ